MKRRAFHSCKKCSSRNVDKDSYAFPSNIDKKIKDQKEKIKIK